MVRSLPLFRYQATGASKQAWKRTTTFGELLSKLAENVAD
jgi:hypothetical protein